MTNLEENQLTKVEIIETLQGAIRNIHQPFLELEIPVKHTIVMNRGMESIDKLIRQLMKEGGN